MCEREMPLTRRHSSPKRLAVQSRISEQQTHCRHPVQARHDVRPPNLFRGVGTCSVVRTSPEVMSAVSTSVWVNPLSPYAARNVIRAWPQLSG